jgi:predicted ester cyclase
MRSLLPLAVLLALATGLGLLAVATTLSQAPLTVAPATGDATAAVQRFYAAADLALRTGDTMALQDAVAPGYVDHATRTKAPTSVLGYAQFLAELRAACPDCRLTAQELTVGHDQAAVRVAVQGHRRVTDLGVSGDGLPLVWSALDVLQIAGGQVAERWSRGDPLALAGSLLTDVPAEGAADAATVQMARLILGSGARLPPLEVSGSALLVVEEGTVAVRTEGAVGVGPRPEEVLTPGLRHIVRNDGLSRVIVLVIATEPVAFLPEDRESLPR